MKKNLLLLLGVIALTIVPLFYHRAGSAEELFTGTDDQGPAMIRRDHPEYRPWFHSLWTPPSDEVESLLFSLQAALGAGVICYYFGLRHGRSQRAAMESKCT